MHKNQWTNEDMKSVYYPWNKEDTSSFCTKINARNAQIRVL